MRISLAGAGLAILFFVLALGGCSGTDTVTVTIDENCILRDGDGVRIEELTIWAGGNVEWNNQHDDEVVMDFDNTAIFGTRTITLRAGETKTTTVECGSGDSATFEMTCGGGPHTGPRVVVEDPP